MSSKATLHDVKTAIVNDRWEAVIYRATSRVMGTYYLVELLPRGGGELTLMDEHFDTIEEAISALPALAARVDNQKR